MRVRRYLLAAGLIATVALAGCGNDSSSNTASSTGGGAQDAPAAAAPERAAAGTAKDQAAAPDAQAPDLSIDQRSIIYTGSITVRVKDVGAAAAQASAFATGSGGFVGGDERHSGSSAGTDNASLTLRVPSEKFNAVVEQLAGLGTEQQRGTSTEDVTEQTVDLDARIAIQQARVDSGRRLLAQAKSLTDLVMLEKEVATRESDLASLQAKKRKLADLTALSTITAVLLGPEVAMTTEDDGPPGFLAGLAGGWHALVASLAVLLTVLGALLPWLLVLGIPAWAVVYLIRRFGRRSRPAAAPALAGSGISVPATYPPRGMHVQGRPQGSPGLAPQPPNTPPPSAPPASTPPSSAPPASAQPLSAQPSSTPPPPPGTPPGSGPQSSTPPPASEPPPAAG